MSNLFARADCQHCGVEKFILTTYTREKSWSVGLEDGEYVVDAYCPRCGTKYIHPSQLKHVRTD